MRITISMVVLVGAAAVAIASPVASPGSPKPKDDDDDVGSNVANVGRCPVPTRYFQSMSSATDDFIGRLLERSCCKGRL